MAETREIRLDVDKDEAALHALALRYVAKEKPVRRAALLELAAKVELAWVEAEFRDEDEAHNDWVNREMYGKEVEPDPDAVVRYVDGRNLVVRR